MVKDSVVNNQDKIRLNNNNSSNANQSDNPFANANGPIDISDDDLPF